MSQKQQRDTSHRPEAMSASVSQRRWIRTLALVAVAAALIGLAWRQGATTRRAPSPEATASTTTPSSAEPAPTATSVQVPPAPAPSTSTVEPGKLKGRWQRSGEPYVLEIRNIGDKGVVDAAYFNPQPIRVGRAAAVQDGGRLGLFVELRDEGYPGCTYRLVYDAQRDRLEGIYYQAAMQTSYEVVFDRLK